MKHFAFAMALSLAFASTAGSAVEATSSPDPKASRTSVSALASPSKPAAKLSFCCKSPGGKRCNASDCDNCKSFCAGTMVIGGGGKIPTQQKP